MSALYGSAPLVRRRIFAGSLAKIPPNVGLWLACVSGGDAGAHTHLLKAYRKDLVMLDRRAVIGSGLSLAVGGIVASNAAMAAPKRSGAMMTLDECVDSCVASHRMCLETARYCTEQGSSAHIDASHIALLLDCAELCQTTANSMLRRSPQHALLCDACARVCEACARDCAKIAGDARMQTCAQTCRDCAASCKEMASMGM